MKRIHIAPSVVLGLAALLVSGSAMSYTIEPPEHTWDCPPSIIVDETGVPSVADADGGVGIVVSMINAVTTTADSWNNAGAARIVSAKKGSTANFAVADGVPMIRFSDPDSECLNPCLALTQVALIERESGSNSYKTIDSDTVINLNFNWTSQGEDPNTVECFNEYYIENTIEHEVGHTIGLAHSSVTNATMYFSTASCSIARVTLETDDENGIEALYGPGPCTGSLFVPCVAYTQYLDEHDTDSQPSCGGTFSMAGSGTIKGWIEGPYWSDFDLFLEKQTSSGWVQVASSTTTTSTEAITYSASAGTYRFRVFAFSDDGNYTFWYQRPTLFF